MLSIRKKSGDNAQVSGGRKYSGPSTSGFTLIEILVVLAIIALLAAILFPVFAAAREKARQSSCVYNMKQISLSVLQYTGDFDERYPPYLWGSAPAGFPDEIVPILNGTGGNPSSPPAATFVTGPDPTGATVGAHFYSWMDSVYPFVKDTQIFRCPSHNKTVDVSAYPSTFGAGVGSESWVPPSYGVNGFLFGFVDIDDPITHHVPAKHSNIESVASKVMMIHNSREEASWTPSRFYGYITSGSSYPYQPYPSYSEMMRRTFPHSDGQVIAFCDGHIEWKEKPDIEPFTCGGDDACRFWRPEVKAEG